MNNIEGLAYLTNYFDNIFNGRNIDALDIYLDKNYDDDDIPDKETDHVKNSKEYLSQLFVEYPTIMVKVHDAITHDQVIIAFIEWYTNENKIEKTMIKGVCMFILNNENKIIKRHNYIYFDVRK